MKRKLVLLTAMMMAAICLFGCGKSSDCAKNSKKTYKVGIVQYVDDASLNQIQKAVQTELDTQGKKLNVKFDYKDYTFNGQADQSTLNQIMASSFRSQHQLRLWHSLRQKIIRSRLYFRQYRIL